MTANVPVPALMGVTYHPTGNSFMLRGNAMKQPREKKVASIYYSDGGRGNQAYSRLSTTHGHITDCKLDSVVYAGVCVVV